MLNSESWKKDKHAELQIFKQHAVVSYRTYITYRKCLRMSDSLPFIF